MQAILRRESLVLGAAPSALDSLPKRCLRAHGEAPAVGSAKRTRMLLPAPRTPAHACHPCFQPPLLEIAAHDPQAQQAMSGKEADNTPPTDRNGKRQGRAREEVRTNSPSQGNQPARLREAEHALLLVHGARVARRVLLRDAQRLDDVARSGFCEGALAVAMTTEGGREEGAGERARCRTSSAGFAYICLGGFVVAVSAISTILNPDVDVPKQLSTVSLLLYINEVILGTIFGIIVGPHCANIFSPRGWGASSDAITLEVMRVILATGLFAIGVELPGSYMAKHARGLLVLVVPTMAFGWVVVAAIMHGLFPNLVYISCLAIAACLTPTDPIICATIVGGKYAFTHVPRNLRLLISAESAANDGLAYPFLSISIYLTVEASRRVAIGKWFLVGWL
ncbi:Na-H-Exchanger domain-containing protein [Mycena venus]|uniref:Na-H-Exchanger domain-containing protein n=1 Tax=Mycena venus TaxID=2733690 RepID=A0A8H6Z734_9AGAR|nr:Na-H-Exchanger domain-containing protein [Mycena venus]